MKSSVEHIAYYTEKVSRIHIDSSIQEKKSVQTWQVNGIQKGFAPTNCKKGA